MSDRECRICHATKPIELFAKDKRLPLGIDRICHACKLESVARIKRAKYNSDPTEREKTKLRDSNRAKLPRARNPVKEHARRTLNSAIRFGRIQRPETCEDCGVNCSPHGHHEDYSKPLSVAWLCQPCHAKRHRKYA